jgi:tetratricopeptide (TPR) repeat protein
MKLRRPFLGVLILLACVDLQAQNLVLKDGRIVPAPKMRRTGENLFVAVQIGSSQGEAGIPYASIVRADFPPPAELATAAELIAQGKNEEALAALAPAFGFFQPIADVPGSWWPQLALLKAEALEKSGRSKDSAVLLDQIVRSAKDPTSVEMARLRLTRSLIAQGKYAEAQAICDAALEKHADNGAISAECWIRSGDIQFAQKQYEPALLAYLHVPALYARQSAFMPAALLGSARAYIGLKEIPRGTEALSEIVQEFPSTAEAKTASEELKRLTQSESESKP